MKTKTIFRMIKGEVLALFPENPAAVQSWFCECYAHVGQHSSACISMTSAGRLATPEEYAPLKRELEVVGYDLEIRQKRTRQMDEKRMQNLHDFRA